MEQNNPTTQNTNINNADKHPKLTFTLLCAYFLLAAMYLPLAVFVNMGPWLSAVSALAVCVLGAIALTKIAGSFKPFVFYAFIVAIFALFGGSFLPMSLLVAFVTGTCVYANLLIGGRSSIIYILPAIPPIIAFALMGKAIGAVLSLLFVPAAVLLAYSIKKVKARVGAVCSVSLGICIMLVLLLAAIVYRFAGELSLSALKYSIDTARTYLTDAVSAVLDEVGAMLGSNIVLLDTAALPSLLVGALFNLLPGIIITAANILAYIIHSLYLSATYSMTPEKRKEAIPMLTFDLSVISAVVYVLSLVLSLTLNTGSAALYGTAAQNLLLILAPGLVMTALGGVRILSMRKGPSCLGTLAYFALIFMIATLSPIVILAVALGGAVLVIITHIAHAKHPSDN